jgi:mono/diheme cytochrome c family protein
MNRWLGLLALLVLAACDGPRSDERSSDGLIAAAAAVSYDGSDAAERTERVTHGERLTRILGCKACHGDDLRGSNVTKDDPSMGDWWAPNVTLLMSKYNDAELDRLIRHGEPKDKRPFYFMPAEALQFVSDADLQAVIAYLRTLEPGGEQVPPVKKGPTFVELERKGEFAPSLEMVRRFRAEQPPDLGDQHKLGRYIAMTVCTECHNAKLQGFEGFSPDLDIAGAYEPSELTRLLTTGEGKVKKDLGLMTATSRMRFSNFTPAEREAIVRYIVARAANPEPHSP